MEHASLSGVYSERMKEKSHKYNPCCMGYIHTQSWHHFITTQSICDLFKLPWNFFWKYYAHLETVGPMQCAISHYQIYPVVCSRIKANAILCCSRWVLFYFVFVFVERLLIKLVTLVASVSSRVVSQRSCCCYLVIL